MNRRELLQGCADFMKTVTGAEGLNYSLAEDTNEETLVIVFLRGGYDGLNFLAPVDDPNYVAARSENVRITESGRNTGLQIDQSFLDADFRLHKLAKPIKELYDDKKLGFVHASGLQNGTRSHFVAQELIEKGTEKEKSLTSGWLTRHLQLGGEKSVSTYALGNTQPDSLLSASKVLSLRKVEDLQVGWSTHMEQLMMESYGIGNSLVHKQGFDAINMLNYLDEKSKAVNLHKQQQAKVKKGKKKKNKTKFADNLSTLESLIKMDIGLRIATVNMGGWDTHDSQESRYTANMRDLCTSLSGFYNRLSKYHNKLTVVVMSEFGRRVKGNNNAGTDHGYGNAMWVLGGNVNGGNIYGKWPGLANDQLDKGVDLAITTDYRTVLSEVLTKRLKQKDLKTIFPKFNGPKGVGIVRA